MSVCGWRAWAFGIAEVVQGQGEGEARQPRAVRQGHLRQDALGKQAWKPYRQNNIYVIAFTSNARPEIFEFSVAYRPPKIRKFRAERSPLCTQAVAVATILAPKQKVPRLRME